MRNRTLLPAVLLVTAVVFTTVAEAPPPAPAKGAGHLSALRLLPPVLVRGEKGWTLDERMKHYKVEGVSVAVFRDYRVVWAEARGLADREAKQTEIGRAHV